VYRIACAQPFDILCKEKCEERSDCQTAHVLVETFETINVGHLKPPPPSPPTPPIPPPSPLPPLNPFPPLLPPLHGDPIRIFSPLALEAPDADVDGLFAITCAVEHCGDGLPIFKSSSQIGIVAKVTAMAESGSLFRSACAYECARTITSHALSLDDFTQLFTTSTLPSAFFSYPRLSLLQQSVHSETQTDGDGNLGASSQGVSEGTFSTLERIAVGHNLTMQECAAFFDERKNIAMHAVWLYNDDTTELAIGDCSLFLAARSTFQHTLWDSFFEHARRVTAIGHFETAVPSKDHVAVARPPAGEDCNFDHRTFGGAASAANTDTTWRACVWWSEFQSDVQDELACSPDRDGSNVISPNERLANLRDSNIAYPPPSPPPPPPLPDGIPPPPPDQNFRCAAGMLPRTSPEQSAPRCWEWSDRIATIAPPPPPPHESVTFPYSHDSDFWPPFAVHGDVYSDNVGGCRASPPPMPPSNPPPPTPSFPPPPSPLPLPPPPPTPPQPPCIQKGDGCVKFYVIAKTSGSFASVFEAWNECMQPGKTDTQSRYHTRRGLPAIWWGSNAHATEFWDEVYIAMSNNGDQPVATSLNDICNEGEYNGIGLRNKMSDPTRGWLMDYWRGPHEASRHGRRMSQKNASRARTRELQGAGFPGGTWPPPPPTSNILPNDKCEYYDPRGMPNCVTNASSYISYARQRLRWGGGQPDDDNQEDCTGVRPWDGGYYLNDFSCSDGFKMVACMTTDPYIEEQITERDEHVTQHALYPHSDILFEDFQTLVDTGQDPISWLLDDATFGARGRYYGTQPIHNDNGASFDDGMVQSYFKNLAGDGVLAAEGLFLHCSGMAATDTIGLRIADENAQVVLDPTQFVYPVGRRRIQAISAAGPVSRLVQWDTTFRQPSFADRASSEPFTGPTFADCSDSDVPDTHCCRARTAFWVSNNPTSERYYKKEPYASGDLEGRIDVTGCRDICGTNFLRYGEDTQCVPVLPECNDWDGANSPGFDVSDLLLLEAYCLCGMKRAVVPSAAERRLTSDYEWPGARGASIDSVTGGHFDATDQCYASSINFHTRMYAESDRRCPTSGGDAMLYTEMTATDIKFERTAPQPVYTACGDASADPLDCCAVDRSDAMGTHYYPAAAAFSNNAAWVAFGRGMPFGTSPSQSRLVFTFDFDRDGTEDVVVGNRMYLSRSVKDGGPVEKWSTHRYTGKRFTSGTPVAMDAVLVDALMEKVFVSIAYDDNSVILYSYNMSPGPSQIVLHWERMLDKGDRGDVTALRMYHYGATSVRPGLDGIERVGVYVAYRDADDALHIVEYPLVTPTAGITGFVPEYSFVTPKRSDDVTPLAAIVPSLAVATATLIDAFFDAYDVFFVATAQGFSNIVVLDHTGFEERSIPNTDTCNSVAVSSMSVSIQTPSDPLSTSNMVLVCFANTNTQNTCHRLVNDATASANVRLSSLNMQRSRNHAFGDANEVTTDIVVIDINQDNFLDVITIEAGGYVRIYRGSYHTQQSGDFSAVVPEPLDPAAAAPDPNEVAPGRRASSIQPGNVLGTERFMSHAKLGIGRCPLCASAMPVRYIIAHYYAPDADAGSCSMRCHHVGRIGFDSFTLYATGIDAIDAHDLDTYYAMGEPTQCLCGPRFDALANP